MTKKDYELIAKVIAKSYRTQLDRIATIPANHPQLADAQAKAKAIEHVTANLSAEFRENNPLYDAHKFMSQSLWIA